MIEVFVDFLKELLAPVFDWIINFFHAPGLLRWVAVVALVIIGVAVFLWKHFNKPVEGTTGEGLQWTLKENTLTISGSGAMTDYAYKEVVPWYKKRKKVQYIVIEHGVTTIGSVHFLNVQT